MLIIPKYYCPHCRKFKTRFGVKNRFGFYIDRNGLDLVGYLLCCSYCENPVVNVYERIMSIIKGIVQESDYVRKYDDV